MKWKEALEFWAVAVGCSLVTTSKGFGFGTGELSPQPPDFKVMGLFLFFPACGKLCFCSVSENKVKFFQDKFIVSDLERKKQVFCAYLKCVFEMKMKEKQ